MVHSFHKNLTPYYYVVVKFLDKPVGVVHDYVCVPDFWTDPARSTDWIVSLAYPVEDHVITTYRAKRPEKPRDNWKHYQAIVVHKSYFYIDPENWIANYHATVENKRLAEKGYQSLPALDGMARSSGDFPPSLNNKPLQTVVAPLKPQKPMIRVSPVVRNRPESPASGADINENRSQTVKAVESTKQSLLEHTNPIDLKIYAVQSSSNLTNNSNPQPKRPVEKQFAPVLQNFPQELPRTPEVRRHIPVCVKNLVREIHTQEIAAARSNNVQINMAFTAPTIKKLSNESNQSWLQQIADYIIAFKCSQSANDRNTKQNDVENAPAPQSLTEGTRSTKRHVRKPKYNPNNSKWTLKYRKRARGLEELVQDSGIYVNVIELAHCRRASDNCNTLARMLLTEVFSHKALTVCTLNGTRGKVHDGNEIRPGLDEFAIKVILKFVEDYGSENQWDKFDYKSVTKSMHNEISKIRAKYGK